ncbi:MAG TPA: hypothetical protein VFF81_03410 [Noviherbaspirillum sp.]|nr:hypothetical protein [Noviherbaspirillum sp.]
MGYEYRLSAPNTTRLALSQAYKNISRLAGASSSEQQIELRTNGHDGMPDATVMLDEDSLYFCDHGGAGKEFLGRVIELLVSSLGAIVVTEHEQ